METQTKPAKGKKTEELEIVVSRLINAPREMVYKAFVDPKQRMQWWGCYGTINHSCEQDVKVGGKWLIKQSVGNEKIHDFYGEFKEVVKNERLVCTFIFDDYPDTEMLSVITLEDKEGKTLVTSTTVVNSAEQRQGMLLFGAVEGTKQTLEKLEEFVTSQSSAGRELMVTCRLNAPRELVWEMWTNPEHIKHWWGPTGYTNTIYKMDVKEGGEWDFTMHGPDGTDYRNTHVFMKLVKNEKIVLQHATAPKFKMEVWMTPQGDKTLLTIRSQFESVEQLKKVIEVFKADVGLKQNVDKLEQYINKLPMEKELVIMRQFNAPRELVFKAWTEPERLAQWWGPKGGDIHVSKLELKPGGTFLYTMKQPNGQDMWGKFVYREITPPEKLVFVNSFSNGDGGITGNPWMPIWPLEILNTLTLTEHEGKTTLTIKGKPINATAEEIKNFEGFRDSMQAGFAGSFEQLDEYLKKN